MYRLRIEDLREWKKERNRKPLLIRGARQVGKTYLIREFAKEFDHFIEINFEIEKDICELIKEKPDPNILLKYLSAHYKIPINGNTLIFFDEMQECEDSIVLMRYFYEKKPEIFLIGAGSILEFAIEKIGMPVGRVRNMYLYPMNFREFLINKGFENYIDLLIEGIMEGKILETVHKDLMRLYGEYMSVGGMPEAVDNYLKYDDMSIVNDVLNDIIEGYRGDFPKYTKRNKTLYIEDVFMSVPLMVGEKFVYSRVGDGLKIREIKNALSLIEKAGIVHRVFHSSASGIPLHKGKKVNRFKVIMMDVGIMQSILSSDVSVWIKSPKEGFLTKGSVVENFIGNELMSYASPFKKKELFYWNREVVVYENGNRRRKKTNAEVDYLIEFKGNIIPLEVKSGEKKFSRSMQKFIEEKGSPFGVILSYSNVSVYKERKNVVLPVYSVFVLDDVLQDIAEKWGFL